MSMINRVCLIKSVNMCSRTGISALLVTILKTIAITALLYDGCTALTNVNHYRRMRSSSVKRISAPFGTPMINIEAGYSADISSFGQAMAIFGQLHKLQLRKDCRPVPELSHEVLALYDTFDETGMISYVELLLSLALIRFIHYGMKDKYLISWIESASKNLNVNNCRYQLGQTSRGQEFQSSLSPQNELIETALHISNKSEHKHDWIHLVVPLGLSISYQLKTITTDMNVTSTIASTIFPRFKPSNAIYFGGLYDVVYATLSMIGELRSVTSVIKECNQHKKLTISSYSSSFPSRGQIGVSRCLMLIDAIVQELQIEFILCYLISQRLDDGMLSQLCSRSGIINGLFLYNIVMEFIGLCLSQRRMECAETIMQRGADTRDSTAAFVGVHAVQTELCRKNLDSILEAADACNWDNVTNSKEHNTNNTHNNYNNNNYDKNYGVNGGGGGGGSAIVLQRAIESIPARGRSTTGSTTGSNMNNSNRSSNRSSSIADSKDTTFHADELPRMISNLIDSTPYDHMRQRQMSIVVFGDGDLSFSARLAQKFMCSMNSSLLNAHKQQNTDATTATSTSNVRLIATVFDTQEKVLRKYQRASSNIEVLKTVKDQQQLNDELVNGSNSTINLATKTSDNSNKYNGKKLKFEAELNFGVDIMRVANYTAIGREDCTKNKNTASPRVRASTTANEGSMDRLLSADMYIFNFPFADTSAPAQADVAAGKADRDSDTRIGTSTGTGANTRTTAHRTKKKNASFDSWYVGRGRHMQLIDALFRTAARAVLRQQQQHQQQRQQQIGKKQNKVHVAVSLLLHQSVEWEVEEIAAKYNFSLIAVGAIEEEGGIGELFERKRTHNDDTFHVYGGIRSSSKSRSAIATTKQAYRRKDVPFDRDKSGTAAAVQKQINDNRIPCGTTIDTTNTTTSTTTITTTVGAGSNSHINSSGHTSSSGGRGNPDPGNVAAAVTQPTGSRTVIVPSAWTFWFERVIS